MVEVTMMFCCAWDSEKHDDVTEVSHKTVPYTIITTYNELLLQLNCTYELATCT